MNSNSNKITIILKHVFIMLTDNFFFNVVTFNNSELISCLLFVFTTYDANLTALLFLVEIIRTLLNQVMMILFVILNSVTYYK